MTARLNKPILFASDLSTEMKRVFHYAATQALSQQTDIVILHIMEEDSRAEGKITMFFGQEKYQDLKVQKKQKAHNTLIGKDLEGHQIRQAIAGFFGEQDAAKNSPSLIKDILIKERHSIVEEIVSTATEEDCQMIVIGCRKQGMLSSVIGDHVVRDIFKISDIPVLVVPFSESPKANN